MSGEKKQTSRNRGGFEWDFVAGFIVFLAIWLFVGYPLLLSFAYKHPIAAYGIYISVYTILFFMLGQSFHQGIMTAVFGVIGYIVLIIWSPPLMIPSSLIIIHPILVLISIICLVASIFMFILFQRVRLPFGSLVMGLLLLIGIGMMAVGLKYDGDPFTKATCNATGDAPNTMYCINSNGYAQIPSNLSLASDSFIYQFFRNILKFPHLLAWLFTYIIAPVIVISMFAIYLTRDQMKKLVVDGWHKDG
jgi:hypothetical protein